MAALDAPSTIVSVSPTAKSGTAVATAVPETTTAFVWWLRSGIDSQGGFRIVQ